jgi:hypothetical protein
MPWQDLVQNHPDIATFWSLVFAAGGAAITLVTKGLLKLSATLRRPTPDGHHEAIVRVQIGRDSSDEIKSQPELPAVQDISKK